MKFHEIPRLQSRASPFGPVAGPNLGCCAAPEIIHLTRCLAKRMKRWPQAAATAAASRPSHEKKKTLDLSFKPRITLPEIGSKSDLGRDFRVSKAS